MKNFFLFFTAEKKKIFQKIFLLKKIGKLEIVNDFSMIFHNATVRTLYKEGVSVDISSGVSSRVYS